MRAVSTGPGVREKNRPMFVSYTLLAGREVRVIPSRSTTRKEIMSAEPGVITCKVTVLRDSDQFQIAGCVIMRFLVLPTSMLPKIFSAQTSFSPLVSAGHGHVDQGRRSRRRDHSGRAAQGGRGSHQDSGQRCVPHGLERCVPTQCLRQFARLMLSISFPLNTSREHTRHDACSLVARK